MAATAIRARVAPVTIFLARPERVGEGIPLAVKDLFDTAGLRTTYGSILFADHVPDRTAEAVVRLEAAGYANVGKTNLHEFAYGIGSYNPHFGDVSNPLAPGRTAGGSSSGSAAALAAGLADAALGSDSGGSIRIPAACCGIVGFKPSHGLVPLEGCFPLAPSFDHAGPMGRDVETCARMLDALAPGFERPGAGLARGARGRGRLAGAAEPLVRARVQAAAELSRAVATSRSRFPRGVGRGVHARGGRVAPRALPGARRRLRRQPAGEARALPAGDGRGVRGGTAPPGGVSGAGRGGASRDSTCSSRRRSASSPRPPSRDDLRIRDAVIRFTYPFNAFGWPALALPCGPAEDGLPASVQLAAPAGEDARVVAAGALLERWLARRSQG